MRLRIARAELQRLRAYQHLLASYEQMGGLSSNRVERLQDEAERLMCGLVNPPHRAALRMARRYAVSAHDARFPAVAENLGVRLLTEDAKLRALAPALTQSLSNALNA